MLSVADNTGTGAGLVEFLDYVAGKGMMNASTAKAYRAAAREILSAVEEDWSSLDLRTIDVDDFIQRFQTKAGMRYTPRSLSTYRSRFRNAVQMYLAYIEDPGGWRPPRPQPSRAASSSSSPRRTQRSDTPLSLPSSATINKTSIALPSRPEMVSYPFPLRRGSGVVLATLILPTDLTAKEAERISALVQTLAIPEQPALPRPTQEHDGARPAD